MRIPPRMVVPCLFLLLAPAVAGEQQSRQREPAGQQTGADGQGEAGGADFYAVPEGDAAQLLQFFRRIEAFRPSTVPEFLANRQKALPAMKDAADRILALEAGAASEAARTARDFLLKLKVEGLLEAPVQEQKEVFSAVHQHLLGLDKLSRNELALAHTAASRIELLGNYELAAQAYGAFGQMFSALDDPELAGYGQQMSAAARRVSLPGNEIKLFGNTLDGASFDWSAYRGKVVLVDFWATWCGECLAELPNVKRLYEQYHDRGFEVVGISLDTERERLKGFLRERNVPWVTLFEEEAGWDHPVAAYYGVSRLPTVMLVNREGEVVSLDAYGPELSQMLAQLFGPPSGRLAEGE